LDYLWSDDAVKDIYPAIFDFLKDSNSTKDVKNDNRSLKFLG